MKPVYQSLLILMLPIILIFSGCDQYEYSSPLPGIVQLNFKSAYTQFDTTFSLNNFNVSITRVQAIRDDGAKANIFQDIKAINRRRDTHNMLGKPAYDSLEVIGEYPLPPGNYRQIELILEPGTTLTLDGYRIISVIRPVNYASTIILNHPFNVEESRTTKLTITVDLDKTLRKLAYEFEYNPHMYVSSAVIY